MYECLADLEQKLNEHYYMLFQKTKKVKGNMGLEIRKMMGKERASSSSSSSNDI